MLQSVNISNIIKGEQINKLKCIYLCNMKLTDVKKPENVIISLYIIHFFILVC